MRVLLLQLDGKLPNIALMRISAHHRMLGDEIELRHAPNPEAVERPLTDGHYDTIYASAIFEWSRPIVQRVLEIWPHANVGGTGVDLQTSLEQHGVPKTQDYTIYPRFAASIGFTQRGCRLSCKFCVVPEKEGKVREEHTIHEIWRGAGHPKNILLLDNDFFGAPVWQDRVEELKRGDFKVCFSQGINARMLDDETAAAIASVRYYDDQFKQPRIYTAWDNLKDEERLFRGLDALKSRGVRPQQIMVYMLCGYWPGETHEQREHRRRRLREYGTRPYPMPYVRTPELVSYQRWVIGAWDKTIPWEAWCVAKAQPAKAARDHDQRVHQLRIID